MNPLGINTEDNILYSLTLLRKTRRVLYEDANLVFVAYIINTKRWKEYPVSGFSYWYFPRGAFFQKGSSPALSPPPRFPLTNPPSGRILACKREEGIYAGTEVLFGGLPVRQVRYGLFPLCPSFPIRKKRKRTAARNKRPGCFLFPKNIGGTAV